MIVGLLSWWNESPSTLTRAIVPLARFCEHVIAIDGVYAAMPGAELAPSSPGAQADAVVAAVEASGLGLTMHRPSAPWPSEVAKRDALFAAAGLVCQPGDWLFVLDADELVRDVPADLVERLARSDRDVATVEYENDGGTAHDRRFVRWSRELRVEGNHYTWTEGTRLLRGALDGLTPESPEHLAGFRMEHAQQDGPRREQQHAYYDRRDRLGLETTARIPAGGSPVFAFEPREGSRHFAVLVSPDEFHFLWEQGWAELDGQKASVVREDCDAESGLMRFYLDEPYRKPTA